MYLTNNSSISSLLLLIKYVRDSCRFVKQNQHQTEARNVKLLILSTSVWNQGPIVSKKICQRSLANCQLACWNLRSSPSFHPHHHVPSSPAPWTIQRGDAGVVAGLSGNVNSRAGRTVVGQNDLHVSLSRGDEMLTKGGRSHPRVNNVNAMWRSAACLFFVHLSMAPRTWTPSFPPPISLSPSPPFAFLSFHHYHTNTMDGNHQHIIRWAL